MVRSAKKVVGGSQKTVGDQEISRLWGSDREMGVRISVISNAQTLIECLPRQYRFSGTNGPGAQNISLNNDRVKISGIANYVTLRFNISLDVIVINLINLNLRSTVSSYTSV